MSDEFDHISSMGSNMHSNSEGSDSSGSTGSYGEDVLGNMFESNEELSNFMNEIFDGHVADILPFGFGKIFKSQGLFRNDASIQSLLSFMELSSGAITMGSNKIQPLGISILSQKGGRSR